jgi:hypothetical protein
MPFPYHPPISVATTLSVDFTFVDGLDMDGDGDPDVSGSISVATDVDGDGDIELRRASTRPVLSSRI